MQPGNITFQFLVLYMAHNFHLKRCSKIFCLLSEQQCAEVKARELGIDQEGNQYLV